MNPCFALVACITAVDEREHARSGRLPVRRSLMAHVKIASCCCVLSSLLTACRADYPPSGLDQQLAPGVMACQEANPIFGPEVYNRGRGKPQKIVREFCVEDVTRIFKISVQNGRGGGHEERVTSAVIEVNGI